MKRFRYLVMLAMLTGAMLLPAGMMQASAQGADLCAGALAQGDGEYMGYEVVSLTGGSGGQIVLGSTEGGSSLSGGSGNDVLCAWGSGNTLDGGSGNDLLVAPDGGNVFLGGSGNDTMIGVVGDVFDGGSGRNETVATEPVGPVIALTFSWTGGCNIGVELTGFSANTTYTVTIRNEYGPSYLSVTTDDSGHATQAWSRAGTSGGLNQAEVEGVDGAITEWLPACE